MVTAGGIFLGIAFLTVVLTQNLMQWPLPEKVDAGLVRIGGQVDAPGDIDVWNAVPVSEGLEAGIPEAVIKKISHGKDSFRLADIVQGQLDSKRAVKFRGRVDKEWESLSKIKDALTFFASAATDADMSAADARKFGVPGPVVNKLVKESARLAREAAKAAAKAAAEAVPTGAATPVATPAPAAVVAQPTAAAATPKPKGKTFKGSLLAEVVREQPEWLNPLYSGAVLDQDININDAIKCGVPETIARHLAGEGKTFKAGPLNDAITIHPTWQKIWRSRVKRTAIFKTVSRESIAKLGKAHAVTLNDALKVAKLDVGAVLKMNSSDRGKVKADMRNIMVVNNDRRIRANFDKDGFKAGEFRLVQGDVILVGDLNSRFRMAWLVAMSLLVCTVGITNSMLMAVTERFKEIGTMKCLGALDSFVVLLFMLESGMMGIVASALGWVLGFVSIVLVAGFTKGWDVVGNVEPLSVLLTFLYAILAGLVLTIVATIFPAQRAAVMPAAMALRSEI